MKVNARVHCLGSFTSYASLCQKLLETHSRKEVCHLLNLSRQKLQEYASAEIRNCEGVLMLK